MMIYRQNFWIDTRTMEAPELDYHGRILYTMDEDWRWKENFLLLYKVPQLWGRWILNGNGQILSKFNEGAGVFEDKGWSSARF